MKSKKQYEREYLKKKELARSFYNPKLSPSARKVVLTKEKTQLY